MSNGVRRVAMMGIAGLVVAAFSVSIGLVSGIVASAATGCSLGSTLDIVAHEDDDLFFQSPALLHNIQAGQCVRTIYVTAGDDGDTATYWQGRETGEQAAYAQMAGVANAWTTTDAGIAGHPIRVLTLTAKPNISLAFLRLPDGNLDGSGFASTGYQSLQKLYGGVISTINTVDASSSYTLASLSSTLLALMNGYQPNMINTQDYVGTYGDGDHSDHHTVAYLVLAAQQLYTTPHGFAGYQGYGIANKAANVVDPDLTTKTNAFLLYGSYDSKTCSTVATCAVRAEGTWFSRQYTVGTPIPIPNSTPTPTPTPTPTATPTPSPGTNVAGTATVTASSQNTSTGQTAVKAVDGVIDGYPGDYTKEWATLSGKAGSYLNLAWASPVSLTSVVLYDRPNTDDQVTGGTLTFSDGSTVAVPSLSNTGAATTVAFSAKSTTSLRFTATSVSTTTVNIGLAELQAFTPATTAAAMTGGSGEISAAAFLASATVLTSPAVPLILPGALAATTDAGQITPAAFLASATVTRSAAVQEVAPGASAAIARMSLGRAPTVLAPQSTDIPSVLGTVMRYTASGATVAVQPTEATSAGSGATSATRIVRIVVRFSAVTGSPAYAPTNLVLRSPNGTVYEASAYGPGGATAPLGTGTLSAGGTVEGAVFFQVPTVTPTLVLGYAPSATHTVLGTWMLSAP
jgi:LmbE family N-acetylglucosaminyl deacetylase